MTTLGMLLAYDDDGNVVGTLDHMVARDADGTVVGLVDFAAHEEAGGEHTDIWQVQNVQTDADGTVTEWAAKGSKVWPEWLGGRAHEFKVELEGPAGKKRIKALVHKESGHRRERAAVDAAIEQRVKDATKDEPADIRDLVGGPDRPLLMDDSGRDRPKTKPVAKKQLPFIGRIDGPAEE